MSIHWSKFIAPLLGIGGALLGVPGIGAAASSALGLGGGSSPPPSAPQGGDSWGLGNTYTPTGSETAGNPSSPIQLPSSLTTGQQSGGPAGGSILPALGALGGSAAGYLGQQQTNAANAEMAQKQMDFQAQQSATSWQRGVTDMKAAGLNPMLAYSQGGASSMQGSSAVMGNSLGAAANSARDAASTISAIQQQQKTIEMTDAQIANTDADTLAKLKQPAYIAAQTAESAGRTGMQPVQTALAGAQVAREAQSARNLDALTGQIAAGMPSVRARAQVDTASIGADTAKRGAESDSSVSQAALDRWAIPKARSEGTWYSDHPDMGPWISRMGDLSAGVNSAAGLARLGRR